MYAKLLTKEYTIDRQLTIHDSEDNVVPIVKPALEVKNHKTRIKQNSIILIEFSNIFLRNHL